MLLLLKHKVAEINADAEEPLKDEYGNIIEVPVAG